MTVPRYGIPVVNAFRRIRTTVEFEPIEVSNSTGTVDARSLRLYYERRRARGKCNTPAAICPQEGSRGRGVISPGAEGISNIAYNALGILYAIMEICQVQNGRKPASPCGGGDPRQRVEGGVPDFGEKQNPSGQPLSHAVRVTAPLSGEPSFCAGGGFFDIL